MKTVRRSLSSDSWEFSWSTKLRKRRPLVVPQCQSGRNVTLSGFLLCFISVYLLSCGLLLAGLSTWSLIRKIPYTYLVDINVDIPYFSLPVSVLCLPSSWIAMSIHNDRKKFRFLHLLVLLLLVSISLLATGSGLGTISKINYSNMTLMISTLNEHHLNVSLQSTILDYDAIPNCRYYWDKMQMQLGCCGVMDYTDWVKMHHIVPHSCCLNDICNNWSDFFDRGCLESIGRDLVWHKNILSSQCYITMLLQVLAIILVAAVYFSEKHGN